VLELMAEGMTNSEIGEQLGVTERTVKAYAQELYDKLGVRNRAGAPSPRPPSSGCCRPGVAGRADPGAGPVGASPRGVRTGGRGGAR
jgi:hypothetical protein